MHAAFHEQFARIGKALASPGRLCLLDVLAQSSRTVEDLATASGLTVANTSQHLHVLAQAHLVASDKRGLHVHYRIAGPAVGSLLACLQRTASLQLAEVARLAQTHLGAGDALEGVDRQELHRRIAAGEVTLIDVRPVDEYTAGHLSGALSVPLPDLAKHLTALPRNRIVVAYCRGPYCAMSGEAVAALTKRGYRARRLPDGVLEWREAGLPTAHGAPSATPVRRTGKPGGPHEVRPHLVDRRSRNRLQRLASGQLRPHPGR